jgi:hypothetical protein
VSDESVSSPVRSIIRGFALRRGVFGESGGGNDGIAESEYGRRRWGGVGALSEAEARNDCGGDTRVSAGV